MSKHLISKSDKQQRGRYSPTTERNKDTPMNSFLNDHQDSLKITLVRHKFLSKKEYDKVLYQRNRNKLKFYEKDEFTDYVVNHYQNLSSTNVCLVPDLSQWKRLIHSTEDGVQINLSRVASDSADSRPVQDVQGEQQDQKDNSKAKSSTQSSVPTPQKRRKTDSKENVMEFHCRDADPEVDAVSPLTKDYTHALEKPPADELKSSSPVSSQSTPAKINLEDFLEDISSNSECFSDEEKKEISLGTDPPDAREFNHHRQAIPGKRYDRTKFLRYEFRQPFRRPHYRMGCPWPGNENYFKRYDDIDRFRERPNLYHEGHRWKYSSSYPFHGYMRKRRFHETYNQYTRYSPPYMSKTSYNRPYVPYKYHYYQRRPSPWVSEYNMDTRRFQRPVNPNYSPVRHTRDDCIASGNKYSRSSHSTNVSNESSQKRPYKKK